MSQTNSGKHTRTHAHFKYTNMKFKKKTDLKQDRTRMNILTGHFK